MQQRQLGLYRDRYDLLTVNRQLVDYRTTIKLRLITMREPDNFSV